MRYTAIILTALFLSCATTERNNPFDAKGENWNPPVVTMTVKAYASVDINDSLAVTATAIDNGTIVKYIWSRNGNTYADSTATGSLKVAYPNIGRHVVLVKAIDNNGVASLPDSCVIQVTLDPPKVTAMPDCSVNINDSLTLTATATDNGTILKYLWALNGNTYSDTTVLGALKVAYPDSGQHVVQVKVIDNDGVVSQPDSCVVTVTYGAPVVTAMPDCSVNINDSLTLTATATDNGTIVKYVWARDGNLYSDTTTNGSLKVAYPDSGQHVVRVKVIDDDELVSQSYFCVVTVTYDAPIVTARSDTIVSLTTTTSVIVTVHASDNNATGSIAKYYWDMSLDGWDDSTTVPSYTFTTSTGGPVTVRWAAHDDDGVFSYDTFRVIFSRPPVSATVTVPTSNESWITFNDTTGKGSFPVTLSANDPDGTSDTLTYMLYIGVSADLLTQVYTGRSSTYTLANIDSSATLYYRLVVYDLFGDSVTSTGTFVTLPPRFVAIDIDGNCYKTVIIGNQIWTIENLRVTKYNDGTAITLVTSQNGWANLSTPGYCFHKNSTDTAYQKKWGALYNWYAVNTGKLAPTGWHVPTDAEWDTLQNYLIANGYNYDGTTTGNKIGMALAAKTDWSLSPTIGSIGSDLSKHNSSGFSALPGDCRSNQGGFGNLSYSGYWWSATEADASSAWYRFLFYSNDNLGRNHSYGKSAGFSVRLVRD